MENKYTSRDSANSQGRHVLSTGSSMGETGDSIKGKKSLWAFWGSLKYGKNRATALLFIIFTVSLILKLYNVEKCNLWFDELKTNKFSYQIISSKAKIQNIPATALFLRKITTEANTNYSTFYYFLTYVYSYFFGGWESLRYLSLLFGMLSLAMFYKLSKLLLKKEETVYALVIMGLSPFQLWYAQEARAYTLVCFLSILFIYIFFKASISNKFIYWIYLLIIGIINVYTDSYSSILVMISGFLIFFIRDRSIKRRTAYLLLAIVALLLMVPLAAFQHFNFMLKNSWLNLPVSESIPLTLGVLILGYSATWNQLITGTIFFIILFIRGVYVYYKSGRKEAITLLSFFLITIIFSYLFSKLIMPIYLFRKFIIITPFYYLFLSKGIVSIKNKILKSAVTIIMLFFLLAAINNYYSGFMISRSNGTDFYPGVHSKKEYTGLLTYVIQNMDREDIICAADSQSFCIMTSFLQRKTGQTPENIYAAFYPCLLPKYESTFLQIPEKYIAAFSGKDGPFCSHLLHSGKVLVDDITVINKFRRIWLISSAWEKQGPLLPNALAIKKYFKDRYMKITSKEKEGIFIELYLNKGA